MTSLAPVIVELAKQQGILTIFLAIKSFRAFEDAEIAQRAAEAEQQLRQSCDVVIPVDSEALCQVSGCTSDRIDFLANVPQIMAVVCQLIEGLLYITCNYFWKLGFLREHGGDVRMAIFKGRGASCVTNIVHDIDNSPLLGNALQNCRHMLRFYFLAPQRVSLSDSAELGLAITAHSADTCEVDGGVSFNEQMDDDMMLMLLVAD